MEKIIHFTLPAKATPTQLEVVAAARDRHPGWELRVWQDPVPTDGFLLQKYHSKVNSGAQLADLIRLDVVHLQGGIYLDSDIHLARPLDRLLDLDHFACSEDGKNLTNAAFGATRGHPLVRQLIENLLAGEPDWTQPPNETTGPELFSRVLRWWPGLVVLPRDTFYPYNWNETERPPLVTTLGVHRWAASWKDKPHDQPAPSAPVTDEPWAKAFARRVLQRVVEAATNEVRANAMPTPARYVYGQDLIVNTTRGLRMSLPGSDLSITPEIALNGTYEESELLFVERTLRGGDFFVDVGCNVGIFSLVAARRVGPFGRVHSFDANGKVLEHLRRSLVMNWLHDRVVVHHRAVGSNEAMVSLTVAETCLGGSNLGGNDNAVYDRTVAETGTTYTVDVQQVRLDRVFPLALEIKLLKIDVEGFEAAVIDGAEQLFQQRAVGHVMLELVEEISSAAFQRNVEAVKRIMACGYALHTLAADGTLRQAPSLAKAIRRSRNMILVRQDDH